MCDLKWPENPTCHDHDYQAKQFGPQTWRDPRPDDGGPYLENFRTCSYCGCIHPEDLLKADSLGATLQGSDWKYAWPHKFYVVIPNPKAGQSARLGGRSIFGEPTDSDRAQYSNWRETVSGRWEGDLIGPAGATMHAKWYNQHLFDLDDAAFDALSSMILAQTGIQFIRGDGILHYIDTTKVSPAV